LLCRLAYSGGVEPLLILVQGAVVLSSDVLSREEKLRFLKTLEVDPEFRLAVAGLLGLREILEELRELREDFNKFVAMQEERWAENNKRWEEAYKRFEAIETELARLREEFNRRWEENNKRWLENEKKWEEAYKRFERIEAILAKHSEAIAELARAVGELKATIGSIGRRWGRDLELTVLNLYRDMLEKLGVEVERIEKLSIRDYEGKYLQRGAKIEIDIYVSDKVTYLIEVKSFVDEDDVEWFNTKCEIVARERKLSSYRKLLVAVNIVREALERARELGVDAIYGSVID